MNKTLRTIAAISALLGATAVWAGGPASGEFSGVDQVESQPAVSLTRATVLVAATPTQDAAHKVNSKTSQSPEGTQLTRAEVREQGRIALQSGKIPTGEMSY